MFEEYVARVVAEAPPLTAEQRESIAGLLGGERQASEPRVVHSAPPARKPEPRPCSLYRHYDEFDVLLYAGISVDPISRTKAHHRSSTWVQFAHRCEVQEFASEAEALDAEREAIRTERPLFNVQHSTRADFAADLITYMHQRARKEASA